MAETFGCCSHYVECSEHEKCLFLTDDDYSGCQYRKNLENGRIFYGSKKGMTKVITFVPVKKHERLYIKCYDRLFNVNRLLKNGFSQRLSEEEFEILEGKFEELKIPFATEKEDSICIVEGDAREPANSRVIFSLQGDEKEYVVANFNVWFIRKRYADGIEKALKNKGLIARVELLGSYASCKTYSREKPEIRQTEKDYKTVHKANDEQVKKIQENLSEVKQISFYDLFAKAQ